MKNILKRGINSNILKTIAIIAMVIDHIGFYFVTCIPNDIYIVCRAVGRIAMPIFVYLLVQGFFHTKNFKKYFCRIGIYAIITQLLITLLMIINIQYIPMYTSAKQVYTSGNILFSFTLVLITLKLLHKEILVKKWDYNKNVSLKIILIAFLIIIGVILPIDYGEQVVVLAILMYYIEKIRIKVLIGKSDSNITIKNVLLNSVSDTKLKLIYLVLILLALSSITVYFNAYWTITLSIIPISLYNGERGRRNMKNIYYITFPIQHVLLYSLAMLTMLT